MPAIFLLIALLAALHTETCEGRLCLYNGFAYVATKVIPIYLLQRFYYSRQFGLPLY